MIEINRSSSPEQVEAARKAIIEAGGIEVHSKEEASTLEAAGKLVFIDHTKGGIECFPEAEMQDFRRTDCRVPGEFDRHLRRFGR